MAERTVNFIQIYFKEHHRGSLFSFADPYYNHTLTPFFENSVIAAVVPKSEADVTSVCSWALRAKMMSGLPPRRELTLEMLQGDYDVLSFTKNSTSHDSLAFMEAFHKGSISILREIWAELGLQMPKKVSNPIYQNAFSARTEIYNQYVSEFLVPAMEVMESNVEIKECCWQDSGYKTSILGIPVDFGRIEEFFGVRHFPMHPFLLERCFSLWIEGKHLNVQYV